MCSPQEHVPALWELPDALLFHILTFAAGPTRKAYVVCHLLAPTCREAKHALLDDGKRAASIWDTILVGDYGGNPEEDFSGNAGRRKSKRLCSSVMTKVQRAHQLIKYRTELAYSDLCDLSRGQAGGSSLTKSALCSILEEFGPNLRINECTAAGGIFLVEICRARGSAQATILKCVKELVERYGAQLDCRTNESGNSQLTALCVASVRGMPKVVDYLLERGASIHALSSGRFQLHARGASGHQNLSHRCANATPLEFAKSMREAEVKAGSTLSDLKALDQCIRLLTR